MQHDTHMTIALPDDVRGPDRVCFVIAVEKAAQHTLNFVHRPGAIAVH